MTLKKILIVLLFVGLRSCIGYRILAIFPFHGRSHTAVLQPLAKVMAMRGHQVDVISHFPLKESFPNYTDIIQLEKPDKHLLMLDYDILKSMDGRIEWSLKNIFLKCDLLSLPSISNLVKSMQENKIKYDLLLIHGWFAAQAKQRRQQLLEGIIDITLEFMSGYQCLPAIGHLADIPVVAVMTTTLYPWMHTYVDNPLNLAISRNNLLPYEAPDMSFWERLYNVYSTLTEIYNYHKNAHEQQRYLEKYFGSNVPHYRELEKRTALVLTNSHASYHGVKPKTPGLIEIGGIHIMNGTTPMDKNLKKILDSCKDGFIYFSFGTLAVIETFPPEILEKFYAVFRKLAPIRIIWRVANPELLPKNLPDNVFIYPWLPQQQILQHPNIKAFVTHGGGLGTQEAVYHAIPMVCVPLFAEQEFNCGILAHKKVCTRINYVEAKQEDFDYAFQEIVFNPIYKDNIRKFSVLYRDRPMAPSTEAAYWMEYVIRHGRNVLKSPAVNLKWWQVELLDVYAFIVACLLLLLWVTIIIIRMVFALLRHLWRPYVAKATSISKKFN